MTSACRCGSLPAAYRSATPFSNLFNDILCLCGILFRLLCLNSFGDIWCIVWWQLCVTGGENCSFRFDKPAEEWFNVMIQFYPWKESRLLCFQLYVKSELRKVESHRFCRSPPPHLSVCLTGEEEESPRSWWEVLDSGFASQLQLIVTVLADCVVGCVRLNVTTHGKAARSYLCASHFPCSCGWNAGGAGRSFPLSAAIWEQPCAF